MMRTHSKVHPQCFDVGFVYLADRGEGASEDGVIIFLDSFLDEAWGLELELLVCCQIMSCFFISCEKE